MTALYQHSALLKPFSGCFTRYSCTLMTLLCTLVHRCRNASVLWE